MAIKILKNFDNVSSLENLIREMSNYDLKSLDIKNLVLVKDNFSLTVEKQILKELGIAGSFSIDVLSFSRLLAKYNNQTIDSRYLTNFGGVMLICKIALENKHNLLCYKNSVGYSGFYKKMYELIILLKGAGISPKDLQYNITAFNAQLKNKIHDIALFFAEYEKQIADRFFDENTKLDILCKVIENNHTIHNSNIFLTNFDSYTRKDYKVLSYILRFAKNVVFSVVVDEKNSAYTNEAYKQIINLLGDLNLEYSEYDFLKNKNAVAEHIRQNLFAYNDFQQKFTDSIQIYEANDYEDELERVAKTINSYIRKGYKYSDFAIISQDHDGYRQRLKNVFSVCDIPYYLATNMQLYDHAAIRLIRDIFDLSNLAKSHVAIAKNAVSNISFESAEKYENYLIKYGYRDILKYECDDFSEIACVHEKCKNIVSSFKKGVYKAKQHCENLLDFFKENAVEQSLISLAKRQKEFSKEAESFTLQVFDCIVEILSQLEFVYGDFFLTSEDFIDMFLSGVMAIKVSVIPMSNDCVMVGSINDLKFSKAKGLFVIGCVDGNIPPVKKDLGLLQENDAMALNFIGLEFHNLQYINQKEYLNLVLALQNFTEFLHISYSRLSGIGERNNRSDFINNLLDIFNGFYVENASIQKSKMSSSTYRDDVIDYVCVSEKYAYQKLIAGYQDFNDQGDDYKKYYSSLYAALKQMHAIDDEFLDMFICRDRKLNNADKLFLYDNHISASTLETFFACPYKNYIQRGLKLFEREQLGLNQMDIGNYLHRIVEEFTIKQGTVKFEYEDCKKTVDEITDKVLNKSAYSYVKDDKTSNVMLSRLKQEAYKVCFHIMKQFRYGKFSLLGTEIDFSQKGFFIDDGVRLSGKIDRVDKYDNYVRIIDYKTGNIDTSLQALYLGTKMQLNLYLKQMQMQGLQPVGGYYFPVHNEFSTKDELDYRLKGRMIDNPQVLQITDSAMQDKSEIISAYISKGEYKTRSKDYLLNEKVFDSTINYSLQLAKKGVGYMRDGIIDINPIDDACKYCASKNICEYDKMRTRKREIKARPTLDTILEATQNDVDKSSGKSD